MKKIMLAVCTTLFLMPHAAGMDQQPHKKQKAESFKQEALSTSVADESGINDYETFKATEQMCEIMEQAVHTMLRKKGFNPVHWIGLTSMWTCKEETLQTHAGLLTKEFNEFYTPWGLKKIIGFDSSISQEIRQEAQKKLIVAFYCKSSDQTTYKVLEVDGKKLPEPIARDSKDFLSVAMVKASLKKHRARYKKETTDEVMPFIPVRPVAEMVTAYVYHPANGQ